MKISDITARLPALYLAACAKGGAVPYFTGAVGIGKTSMLEPFPKLMKRVDPTGSYGIVILNGATLNVATIGGLMQFGADYKGSPTSKFSWPWWMFTKEGKHISEYDGGIIFIDEADKMNLDEGKTVGEASLSKVWFTHWLPEGWVVFFAGNRLIDRSGSHKMLDHLINRQRIIPVEPSNEDWVRWAESVCLLPEVITFGKDNPTLLNEPKPDIQGPWCTSRSLHQAEIHLRALMETFGLEHIPTDPLTEQELAGGIGVGAAAQLVKTIREGQELPSYASVVANPAKAVVPSKPDLKRLMAYKMADNLKNEHAKEVLNGYMDRFETEFQTIFVRLAIAKDYTRAFEGPLGDWCEKHASLIAIIQHYKAQAA
jgi:hypothetical protein